MSDQLDDAPPPVSTSTVETQAERMALQLLEDYLRARPVSAGAAVPGSVVGITGPPGAGKTRIAVRILRAAGAAPRTTALMLNVAGLDADQLRAAFVGLMSKDQVVACVRGYHADLVSALITDEQVARRANESLRTAQQTAADRDEYVSRLGLSPTELAEQLRATLVDVVGDADHAAAFVLLLRDGLDEVAWAWLRGEPPAAVLRERGLTGPVPGGLPALGVFARLFGRQGFRLVLIFDDVEQFNLGQSPDRQVRTLRKLLEEQRAAGSLVYLLGSADALDELEIGPYRRTGTRIAVTGFDADAAARFLRARSGTGTLAPFDEQAVGRMVDLTEGNPRMLGEFADRLLRESRDSGRDITEDVVLTEAREYFAIAKRPRVVATIRRVLDNHLWDYRVDHKATLDEAGGLDFWLPVSGPDQAGCGILITEAVVDSTDVRRLVATAETLDRAGVRAQVLVVMIGAVSAVHAARIQQVFRREPLSFAADTFDEDLAAAIKAMLHAFDDEGSSVPIAGLRDWIDRIDRQQARTVDILDRMSADLAALRVERHVEPPPTAGVDLAKTADDPLPAPVRALFTRALGAVQDLNTPDVLSRGLFGTGAGADDALATLRRVGNVDPGALRALGAVSTVVAVVQEFRIAVQGWFRSVGPARAATPGSREHRELERICTRYEEAVDVIPLAELHQLPPARRRPQRGGHSGVDAASREVRELGREVRAAAERPPAG